MTGASGRSAVLIAGPTAAGKSGLALTFAEVLGGTVINADSLQVYRDLLVLTARPSAAEEARAPHRLYGIADAAETWSVGRWLEAAAAALEEAWATSRVPIVVGGTGLYFEALTKGLARIPEIPDEIRERWRKEGRARDPAVLHAELARRDPATAARLRPSDPQRIVRALEVLDATGRGLSEWQAATGPAPLVGVAVHRFVIAPERDALRAAIAARFTAMLQAGALEEVGALVARGLDPALPVMKALGVAPLAAHLAGALPLEAAVEAAITETRRYAKRQMTWFRGRMADWSWTTPEEALAWATVSAPAS